MGVEKVHYSIKPSDPFAHLFTIRCTLGEPANSGQQFRMPAWIPGSYMIRDFARNVGVVRAFSGTREIPIKKVDKSTWEAAVCDGPLTIEYDVYAWDLSVRAAHVDQTHAYFNGTSVFMAPLGLESEPCTVDLLEPEVAGSENWRVATTLKEAGAERYGFGRYAAENYEELIDHPVEMADFSLVSFDACGVSHDFVLTGRHRADLERIAVDLKKICEYQIRFFGSSAPMERYVFITWVVGSGYGGLEHRSSSSLLCSRDSLPLKKDRGRVSDNYRNFLGLCSHEYFHTWNVKRIRPAAFLPYQLNSEAHTELLWAFEGITSYYDDLTLLETGLINVESYLELIGQTLTRIYRSQGRFKQTVSESSFDAWTKFYKQDENAVNAIISYYAKGSIIALGLDLLLRKLTGNRRSLQTVMGLLWERNGQQRLGLGEQDIEKIVLEVAAAGEPDIESQRIGEAITEYFDVCLRSTEDFELAPLLENFGVKLNLRTAASQKDRGGKALDTNNQNRPTLDAGFVACKGGVRLTNVVQGGAAHGGGLSAGDVIIAIDNLRVDSGHLEGILDSYLPGDTILFHAFRRDELMGFRVTLRACEADTCYLTVSCEEKLKAWLVAGG